MQEEGEFLVRGTIADEANNKVTRREAYLFSGEKTKLSSRDIMTSDCLISSTEGSALIKLCTFKGGSKQLYAGTTLGYVEQLNEDVINECKKIKVIMHADKQNEERRLN